MRACPNCQRTYPDETEFCPRDGTPLPPALEATAAALEAGLSRRFRIVRRLGAGGMGTVFLAEQIAVGNRPVALKVLLRKLLDDPEFLLRFQNEAASTGRIRHPNVVTIYESGQSDDGSPYIAMEYLEGETLRQAIKRRGALPLAECVEILQQVARGLNSAHRLGILHRDLKPDNIFLTHTEDGEKIVKVVDFGLAKMRESATHTLTGTVLGTPAYMSPEQCLGMKSEQLDARSDLYALGVIVYEMLTGRVPFHSDTPIGYLHKHIMETPPPLRAVAPGLSVPPQVEAVVLKALAKDREQRQASALDFSREFANAAGLTSGVATPAPSSPTRVVERPGMDTAGSSQATTQPTRPSGPAPGSRGAPDTAVETPTTPMRISPVPTPPPPVPPQTVEREATPAKSSATALPKFTSPVPKRRKHYVYYFGPVLLLLLAVGGYWTFQRSAPPQTASIPVGSTPSTETRGVPAAIVPPSAPVGMVAIPGGTFAMGRDNSSDPEETPAHSVSVKPFSLDKTPVTQGRYAAHAKASVTNESADLPATNVSWQEASEYCASQGGRLPTEAEWEFAARGTDGRLYPWGNNFAAGLTNSVESGLGKLQPADSHRDAASPFGVLGMSGNVWQWTADGYKPYPGRQPAFKIPADAKVIRGGSYKSDKNHVTATARNLDHASSRSPEIGFRCAKSQ
jgi:serine/threonine-protein kinase